MSISIEDQVNGMPLEQLRADFIKLHQQLKIIGGICHDQSVANQAAWIEWQHGGGAEAGMRWIHNGLVGPGLIPDEDEPYGKEAQAFYDANCSDPMPVCACGRPSNQLWMGHGACSNEHMQDAMGKHEAASK